MIKGDKNMSKVKVQSMVDGTVFIDLPDAKFSRTWEHKGAVKTIDSTILEEAMYEPGVDYMFSQGMLALVDVDEKTHEELVEALPALEEVQSLTNETMRNFMTKMAIDDFKEKMESLSKEQQIMVAQFAIENTLVDMKKVEVLKALTDIDIIKAIQLKADSEAK